MIRDAGLAVLHVNDSFPLRTASRYSCDVRVDSEFFDDVPHGVRYRFPSEFPNAFFIRRLCRQFRDADFSEKLFVRSPFVLGGRRGVFGYRKRVHSFRLGEFHPLFQFALDPLVVGIVLRFRIASFHPQHDGEIRSCREPELFLDSRVFPRYRFDRFFRLDPCRHFVAYLVFQCRQRRVQFGESFFQLVISHGRALVRGFLPPQGVVLRFQSGCFARRPSQLVEDFSELLDR